MVQELIKFLNKAHSQYHSINEIKSILLENGYEELKEQEDFELEKGHNYFVMRNLTALIAFKMPKDIKDYHYQMVAVHSDSPTYKVKEHVTNNTANCAKLVVEGYGGMIHSTWLDKPLSIAGRIVVKEGDSLKSCLLDIDKDLCIIPNVAIHLNRDINEGYKYNPQIDLCPILGDKVEDFSFDKYLSSQLGNKEIVSYDLYLYNRTKATVLGMNDDYIASAKLDDLACDFASLQGLLKAKDNGSISLFASFDNEEVGSETINGADSTFLSDVLMRINSALGYGQEEYFKAIAKSFMISADNAHATHPNHPELSENGSEVLLNKGVVLKHNANMKYTTEGLSGALIKLLGEKASINIQEYFNRSDIRGGSTLGDISISHVSVLSADIGLAQLAMHSSYETMGAKDLQDMIKLIETYYSSNITLEDANIKLA